jgi:hypothetical protein
MKKLAIILCLQVLATSLLSQQSDIIKSTGPYLGQKPPGDTARPFAPAFFGSMFTSFHSGIIFSPDGSYLIFTRVGSKANDRLPDNIYCSYRDKEGKWTQARKLQIPGDKGNDVPSISSDGKYLFMRHGLNQFYWVETSLIEKFKPEH